MYYFFFDNMQIPIPPRALTIKPKNKNKTIQTIGLGEVNILKPTGLTDVNFEIMLPNSKYPFNQSIFRNFRKAKYYLNKFEQMKKSKKPFQFIVVRMKPSGEMLYNTNLRVVLEDYSIKETQEEGFDCFVNIKLKQWKEARTKRVKVTKNEAGELIGTIDAGERPSREQASTFTSDGGTILKQIKRATGQSLDVFSIAKLNKLAVPFAVNVGEVVKLE